MIVIATDGGSITPLTLLVISAETEMCGLIGRPSTSRGRGSLKRYPKQDEQTKRKGEYTGEY